MNPIKKQLNLSQQDRNKLRKQMIPIVVFSIFLIGFFSIIYFYFIQDFEENFEVGTITTYIFLGFTLFFLGVIFYMFWVITLDLKKDQKIQVTGIVTDKKLHIRRKKPGRRSNSKTSRQYSIMIAGEKYKIDPIHYHTVRSNDTVTIEYAPKSKTILHFEIITNEKLFSEEHIIEDNRNHFAAKEIADESFTPQDLDSLKSSFKRRAIRKLLFALPILLVTFGLLQNFQWVLFIFYIPLGVILFIQAFLFILFSFKHNKDLKYGKKQVLPVLISDKSTITSNARSSKYLIKTDKGVIYVDEHTYEALNTGDSLFLFKSKYNEQNLALVSLKDQRFYCY